MHINITKSETGNNKGSSSQLVAYLEKENQMAEKLDQYHQPEFWSAIIETMFSLMK